MTRMPAAVEMDVAEGAEAEGARRATAAFGPSVTSRATDPDPEVPAKAQRRPLSRGVSDPHPHASRRLAFVASVGIGGIAIALAAQSVLGDVFSGFAILVDKPFQVGNFIVVGDLLGTVEHVGFKTTRILSLSGEQLIFSNSDLTSSRIRNYGRMRERRVQCNVGVIYQTSAENVKAIPPMIKRIIEEHQHVRFDRAHFKGFGDFALTYEFVFWVLTPDYNAFMDLKQSINFRLIEEFQKAGIKFAYPTQQLYMSTTEPV